MATMNSTRLLGRQVVSAFPRQQARRFPSPRSTGLSSPRLPFRQQRAQISKSCRPVSRQSKIRGAGKWRFTSTKQSPDPTPHLGSPEPAPSLSQRLKQLSREYGWTAVGWYLALSALDFPFCFLAVRALGTDRIGQWEHAVVESVKSVISMPFPDLIKDGGEAAVEAGEQVQAAIREGSVSSDSTISQAGEVVSDSEATIWTQLALAYAIHKSFIFVRVPLTAATLPRVVKTLRSWGWNIGKKSSKAK